MRGSSFTRRRFMRDAAAAAAAIASTPAAKALGALARTSEQTTAKALWHAPGDAYPHERTWMDAARSPTAQL